MAAATAAACDWWAVATGRKGVEYVAKPSVVALAAVAAATVHPIAPLRRDLFVVALLLSLLGDVFLMLPRDRFLAGLASFLAAQLTYAAAFAIVGAPARTTVVVALVYVAVAGLPAGAILKAVAASGRGLLHVAPVVAYLAGISAMAVLAMATGNATAVAGAALFTVSDTVLGWNRFVRELRFAKLAIIVTYHLAQLLLVASLVT